MTEVPPREKPYSRPDDTVTEMQLVKHAFKAGIPAQRGIEH